MCQKLYLQYQHLLFCKIRRFELSEYEFSGELLRKFSTDFLVHFLRTFSQFKIIIKEKTEFETTHQWIYRAFVRFQALLCSEFV